MRWLFTLNKYLSKIVRFLACTLFIVMGISVLAQIIFRYFFSIGLSWADELSRYTLVWVVFLGGSVAVDSFENTAVTFVKQKLSEKVAKMVRIVFEILIVIFMCFLFITGLRFAELGETTQTLSLGGITLYWPFMAIPVGSILMAFSYIFDILCQLFPQKNKESLR